MRKCHVLGAAAFLSFAFLALALLGGISTRAAADDSKAASGKGGYELVAPLSDLMEVMEDSVFKRIPDRLKAGQFKNIKREGSFLAEFANLTAQEKEHRSNKEWIGFTDQMKEAALKLADAAGKKEEAGVKAQYAAVEKACDACHEKFRDI